jgi:hypothetical protein
MRNKAKAALLAVAAAAGALTAPATAQAAVTDCPIGYFCIWVGTGYTSTRYQWNKSTIDAQANDGFTLPVGPNNRGNSFYNHTTVAINIYDASHCAYSPWTRTMLSGQFANAAGSDWGNRVSSIQIESSAPDC